MRLKLNGEVLSLRRFLPVHVYTYLGSSVIFPRSHISRVRYGGALWQPLPLRLVAEGLPVVPDCTGHPTSITGTRTMIESHNERYIRYST